ncbi:hypothetical protein BCR33DRAFT_767238 [Rhizoclosmatium globosum]|uniref:PIN domain-containing protein n=1 Tax=Rhizoclosmatium globosum TaxID=329046 RepID=A0A1Y2C476_9FUNG|nr:hypothetical protein BCR33DRAFT_767238 [Rhizoclosmatium globosum]|eukprot:ORY41840.1 hypothetical protein BCR33DRAFT_767238 [Rhizoclosmatium globosum]
MSKSAASASNSGSSANSDPVDRLWKQAYSIQQLMARPQTTSSATSYSTSEASLRLQLLYTLSDILQFSVDAFPRGKRNYLRDALGKKNVDDLIWNLVFHAKIEELRAAIAQASRNDPASIPSASNSLKSFLVTATTFYRSLIQSVSVYCTNSSSLSAKSSKLYFGRSDWEGRDDEEFAKFVQRIVYRSVVYLGDLERYKATYNIEGNSTEKWKEVKCIYEYAMRIDPDQGKPQSQLAIVATSCRNHLDALYWYTLSISNTNPLLIAKGNLFTFHQKVSSRIPPVTDADLTSSSLETLSNAIIQFHRTYLFHPDDSRLLTWDSETYTKALTLQTIIYTLVEKFVGSVDERGGEDESTVEEGVSVSKEFSDLLMKTFIVYVAAFCELGNMFAEKDKTPLVRQRIRDSQCLILATLFKVSALCLTRLQTFTSQSPDSASNDETAALFAPVGILCSWLFSTFLEIKTDSGVSVEQLLSAPQTNRNSQRTSQRTSSNSQRTSGGNAGPTIVPMDAFTLFLKYTSGPGVTDFMKHQSNNLFAFCRALATLSTTLLSFADVEGDPRTLPEDLPLLGFTPLKPYYTTTLDFRKLKQSLERGCADDINDSESIVARSSRVLALAKRMGERKESEFFGYEESKNGASAQFIVKDEESKRLARLKTAKTLAVELLKTQISTLESSLSSSSAPTTITYIPDASIYTSHLPLVKTLLIPRRGRNESGKIRLLVPLDVVHQLDILKKGSSGVNARAREATRYLEQRFKFGTDLLVSQQQGETVKDVSYTEVWESDLYTTPPRALKSFIGCCMYFQRKGIKEEQDRVSRMQELGVEVTENLEALDNGRVFVLSDDQEVIDECRRCGVAVKTVEELRRSGLYGRKW